jgi:hypothetical protein
MKPTNNHQVNETIMARWTRNVGLFTLALVIVGMLTAFIFWRQLGVMQDQFEELQSEQRPWISVNITGPASLLQNVEGDLRLHVEYNLVNVGKLPATRVFLYATIVPATDAADFRDTIKVACEQFIGKMNKSPNSVGVTLFPSQNVDSKFGIQEVPITAFTLTSTTTKAPVAAFVPVCAVYRFKGDGGIFHYTPAAYILATPTPTGPVNVDVLHIPSAGIPVEIHGLSQGNLDPT